MPVLSHWLDGGTGPIWTSGGKQPELGGSYGSIAIHDGLGLLALFVFLVLRVAEPQYNLLYGDLELEDSAAIVERPRDEVAR